MRILPRPPAVGATRPERAAAVLLQCAPLSAPAPTGSPPAPGPHAVTQKLYIRTFGCQMNEYDSDKMADVLAAADGLALHRPARGRRRHPVQHLLGAREGAGARVPRPRPRARAEGRAARSHHRRRRLRREPGGRGDRAPRAVRRRRVRAADAAPAAGADRARAARPARRRSTSSFPEIEKFDHLPPPRVEGASAFVSIMEGCSKYCTFCVVPYTRGEEVSRPFDDVLTEVADLADQGVREVTLLGPERQRLPRPDGRRRRGRRLRDAARVRRRGPGHRAHPLHDVAPEGDDGAA